MLKSGRGRRAFAAAFLAATVAAGIAATSAFGVAETIVAADNVYSQPNYAMDQGDRPTLQNVGPTDTHDVFSRLSGPDGNLLFKAPTINPGQTTTVNGTQYLTQGSYQFICNVHPLEMQANLVVSGNGNPVARPDIEVSIGKAKLAKVASKGKLPVTVNAVSEADGVELALKLGKKTIATQKAFDLVAGQSRKITLKINKAGKSKLDDVKSAKLQLTGKVPFGSPDTAKKTLK